MTAFNALTRKIRSPNTQIVQRAVWVLFTALVVVLAMFGGYYYWDRYVSPGDQSPLERDLERMEKVIRDAPQDLDARVALAESYMRAGSYREALAQAGQVLRLHPEHEGALLISGITFVRLSQRQEALVPLQRFVALRSQGAMARTDVTLEAAYYYLGESYVQLDRPEEAIPVLEAALAINPTDADARYQLGLAYQASGDADAALPQFHQAVRFVPDFAEAYASMGESYTYLNRPGHAMYAQGMQAFCTRDYGTAQRLLENATQALPDFAPAFLGLGLTYERMGEMRLALNAVGQALALAEGDYSVQHAFGRIQAIIDAKE